jgi:hypothetical protein
VTIIDTLLASDEPSIRWKIRVHVLGEKPPKKLADEIRTSPRARALIDGVAAAQPRNYYKWQGPHWVVQSLADLGYPPGDPEVVAIVDDVMRAWLAPAHLNAVQLVAGKYRRCGSQQGGALLAGVRLGGSKELRKQLAEHLVEWQWPDGGWNCDKSPKASSSSAHETHLPMRALHAYGDHDAAGRAADVFLERRVLFRRTDGTVIRPIWAKLHYPSYWHYDLLCGLKALAEVGRAGDPRCADALDMLESKRLPDGGWAAEARYHKGAAKTPTTSYDYVNWGGVGKRSNPWITADALFVLRSAGRL